MGILNADDQFSRSTTDGHTTFLAEIEGDYGERTVRSVGNKTLRLSDFLGNGVGSG